MGDQKTLISNCTQDFSASDKMATREWSLYKNSTYNYSFKHPSSWEVIKDEEDSLELSDGTVAFSFNKTKNISKGIKGFKATSKKAVEVACVKADELYLSYNSGFFPKALASTEDLSKRVILAVFTKNDYHFAVSLSYRFEDTTSSSQTNQIFDLILKTIEFE